MPFFIQTINPQKKPHEKPIESIMSHSSKQKKKELMTSLLSLNLHVAHLLN